ncbi:hypothetical protein FRACYDRAFT_241053 [Fragilariopsis cylindrus CCMP1102]|uniref:Uncharacterized protein n=1 Tax=Fragilariopsis cylindrus CCMP1102 TaxID=635003 RepID=A0A1E7F8N0_9STRA|nr:hypothetical protein FRACYDRAFT_241053 [Fragilariopsis cylindrus CCMP1102]|eukprot:OEU14506.1 hypothetical protein FRACYDRAFT_241053 [Fragilariopsis cylindrus CCMP1102]
MLQRKEQYHKRTRKQIDVLVEEFLIDIKDDIFDMLCDNNNNSENYYGGLDSDRDTEEEVETTIMLFPEILSLKSTNENKNCYGPGYYPIQCLTFRYMGLFQLECNLKAVSFIPLLARLATKFGQFMDEQRSGLLSTDGKINVLRDLVRTDTEHYNRDHHELVDTKYLIVMKKLRQMGYLKKEDIRRYDILDTLWDDHILAEKRLRFLVEWDPSSLLQSDKVDNIPLHDAALNLSIQPFQIVFKYGLLYFPKKKGICLLFQNNRNSTTPFQHACSIFGQDEVMTVVEDTLLDYQRSSSHDDSNNAEPYNGVDALIMAAIDESVHLDCVYFLLRRQPDVLVKLLSQSSSSNDDDDNIISHDGDDGISSGINNSSNSNNGHSRSRSRDKDDNSVVVNEAMMVNGNPKKKKRRRKDRG